VDFIFPHPGIESQLSLAGYYELEPAIQKFGTYLPTGVNGGNQHSWTEH
jgi:hypothetical protein